MKKFIKMIIVALLLINYIEIGGAVPVEEWNKIFKYGHHSPTISIDMMAKSVHQTNEGGYILVGIYSYSTIPPAEDTENSDSWLMKTDASGNKQWSKTFGGDGYDIISSVGQTSDGGYILAGWTTSYGVGDGDVWLIKTDSSGNKRWDKRFGGANSDQASAVQQTSDRGYILAGETWINALGPSDMWLIKTDSSGNKQWDKKFGGVSFDSAYSVQQTRDGGYILAGTTQVSTPGGDVNALLVKTDASGNKQWSKTFGGASYDQINYVRQTKDGGYILSGETGNDAWIIKTDSSGNKQWDKKFGGLYEAYSIQQTLDEGYIFVSGAQILKMDKSGNKQWSKTYSNGGFGSIEQTRDKGYIVAGSKTNCPEECAWLVKLSADDINTLKNPGFEESNGIEPKYWEKYQTGTNAIFTYPEIGRGGTGKSVAIKYNIRETGKVALWWQKQIPVSPSSQYKLSGYMKLEGVTGGGTLPRYNGASLRVSWYKSDGGLIKTDVINKAGTSPWTKYEQIFTAPSNAIKATVGGDLFNSAGKVWFDDISFVKIS